VESWSDIEKLIQSLRFNSSHQLKRLTKKTISPGPASTRDLPHLLGVANPELSISATEYVGRLPASLSYPRQNNCPSDAIKLSNKHGRLHLTR